MSSKKPKYLDLLLKEFDNRKNFKKINDQCNPNSDPLFQDFRYGVICDAKEEFKKRNISNSKLLKWKILFSAIFPWDEQYEILRQNVNKRFILYPWVIAMCKNKRQVDKSFKNAIKYDIPICLRGGAHSYEPYSLCDGMVIDQSRRTGIKINKNSVTIEPGALNGPTAYELSKKGLAFPTGTCANVGICGLLLGGGLGFLGRKYGLTCDNLLEFNIIIANGKEIIVNEKNNSDLFWACKGAGGGNFGIITSLTLKTHQIKKVIILELNWNKELLLNVLSTWLEWGPKSDVNLTTELNILAINFSNKLPIQVTGVFIGKSITKLKQIIEPLLKLNPIEIKIWKTTYIDSVRHFTYQKFPSPFFKNKSTYIIKQLPKEIASVIIKYMSLAGPNDRLEIDCLGGAYSSKKSNESAYVHRDALAWIQWINRWGGNSDNITQNPWEDLTKINEKLTWLYSFYNEFRKVGGDSLKGAYVNCLESELINWPIDYYGNNLNRLIEIKKKWDINKIFNFPQGLSELF